MTGIEPSHEDRYKGLKVIKKFTECMGEEAYKVFHCAIVNNVPLPDGGYVLILEKSEGAYFPVVSVEVLYNERGKDVAQDTRWKEFYSCYSKLRRQPVKD